MKKLLFGLIATVMFGFVGNAQTDSQNLLKDPDYQKMIGIQIDIVKSFIEKKVDFEKFDFNNNEEFLKIIDMSKDEYLSNVKLNKELATKLIQKYKLEGKSDLCGLNLDDQISQAKNSLISFQNDPESYLSFQNQLNSNYASKLKCGFWFYAEVALCAATIEAFPVYLLCCAVAYHAECH